MLIIHICVQNLIFKIISTILDERELSFLSFIFSFSLLFYVRILYYTARAGSEFFLKFSHCSKLIISV